MVGECTMTRRSVTGALAVVVVVLSACGGGDGSPAQGVAAQEDSGVAAQEERSQVSRQHTFLNTVCSGDSDGMFTSKLTDIESLQGIVPPGVAASEEIKPHSYMRIAGERAAIYAPIDMELVQGSLYKEPESFVADTTYILHFAVGCDFAINLDHITDPVDEIKAVLNDVPRDGTGMDSFLETPVKFSAGDLIGYTIGAGGEDFIRTFDFGYYSARADNQYVNQDRYLRSFAWKQIHAVCAFDYFPEPLKSAYMDQFVTHTGRLVPGSTCRSPNQDKAGTLAGAWYFEQDSMSVVPHVAIAGDLDGASLIIAGLPSEPYVRIESPEPTYKDPAEVTDRHCYESRGHQALYLYFVIVDTMTADLYEGAGACPSEPGGRVTHLYR